uniref:Uncharacterized protein n=1 Tax=Paraclostridium sordellii TaxID=1505 RepID=A0A2I6SWA8_PARSO|nr:hypothetical protein [Paeniclostridium sordellii]AUO31815.1 hypothetical protein [Paeniclostridium sordellii]
MKKSKEFAEIKAEFIRRGYSISSKIIYGIEYLLITNDKKICGISTFGCRNNRYDIFSFKYYYGDDEDERYLRGDMICGCTLYRKQGKRNTIKKVIEYLNGYEEFNNLKNYLGVIENIKNVQLNQYKKELDSLGCKSAIVNDNRPLMYIPDEILLVNKNYIIIAIYINKGKLYVSNLDYDYIVETKLFVSIDAITDFNLDQIDKWFFTVEDLLNQED